MPIFTARYLQSRLFLRRELLRLREKVAEVAPQGKKSILLIAAGLVARDALAFKHVHNLFARIPSGEDEAEVLTVN